MNKPIQPACPKCTVELNADGTCPQCDREDADPSLTEADLTQALAMVLSPETAEEGYDLLMGAGMLPDSPDGGRFEIQTFEQAGVLTNNAGLVVTIGRAEYQITIVRSR